MKYYTRTVRIKDQGDALEKEIDYIYNNATVINMTITPIIETVQNIRLVKEYWIVYVYC